jgi:phospholipid/cholesterol/gamma-HCH transport system substrate-binding protein
VRRAIGKHLPDFLAILVLFVVAAGVSSYILDKQRLTLPAWVPIVGQDFFTVEGAFSTAQAVTPGQGQTVDIAGVQVGELSKVRLENGRAIITMRLDEKYEGRIRRDASALLRPKTGLKDMIVELDPGTKGPALREGGRIPVSETLPDVNLDEILAALDTDTRDYLKLLVGGGGEALGGDDGGAALRRAIKRFEPTGKGLREVNEQLATRRGNIRRVIHNFSLLSDELGDADDQLADFVDNSNAVFESLASQDRNLRATLSKLPTALDATQTGLAQTRALADELGPTLSSLRPAARALGPSLAGTRPFLRQTTPIIRDELRPFSRSAQPFVRELRPTMRDLAAATPDLDRSFKVVNTLLNTLTYNPPGPKEEGYLFWLSWVNHIGATVFATQDAHGPIRRGIVVVSCTSLGVLDQVTQVNPLLGTLVGLLNAPPTDAVCPSAAGPGTAPAPAPGTARRPRRPRPAFRSPARRRSGRRGARWSSPPPPSGASR